MAELHYTLVSDGSSDKALIPVLDWVIRQSGYDGNLEGECCDFRLFRASTKRKRLAQKISYAIQMLPCDILFVHRDGEKASRDKRVREINASLREVFANPKLEKKPSICVVPVRMTEAWLLFDENAIRRAAGNPHGTEALVLPDQNTLEALPHPEKLLHQLIQQATGLNARRQQKFNVSKSVLRITEYINDFSPLRIFTAFNHLESDVRKFIVDSISQSPPCDS